MIDQESTDPSALLVADNNITSSTHLLSQTLSPVGVEVLNNLRDINEKSEQTSTTLPYGIVRVKHKSIQTILDSIDRVSILFGVQYMFISDGNNENGSQSDERTVLMYFQPITSTKPAICDSKFEDLSKNLQVRFGK